MSDLITTVEALSLLGLQSPASISHWVREGKLVPYYKMPGKTGAYLFNREDILALAETRRTK